MRKWRNTHVLDVDGRTWLAARSDAVDEGVRASWNVGCRGSRGSSTTVTTSESASTASAVTTSKSSAASSIASAVASSATTIWSVEASAKATAWTTEASASAKSATSAKASAASESASVGVTVLTNFKNSSLPVVAVEVLDGVLCVIWGLECDNTRALGSAIWGSVDICACNVTSLTEQVLQILPADRERKL